MLSNTICLYVNLFLVIVNILQILANFVVLIAWCTSKRLLRNDNLILLVSLAFIDFIYAVLQIPYLTVLIAGTKPNGVPPDYNPWLIVLLGGPSAALLKSGWAITNAIAIDRVVAIRFPVQYYKRSKRNWSIGAFAFAIVLAFIDWIILQRTVTIRRLPYCTSFGCFTNDVFRAYSGLSNMVLTFLLCMLIMVILYYLCKGSKTTSLSAEIEMQNRHRIDKNVSFLPKFFLILLLPHFGIAIPCILEEF
ncbi:unnamed protein product [Haemonchus placei]|uniref:G_PROTEIN_RECEP_F1_2 domain-containing protein n=1 Tax=Haemonchus placei TaxID=6290 RepID=A0A0N4VUC2_HAEPC|nr:unnamed protein product [Haemonchus placei]